METEELQAVQAPLKQRYRDEPEAALVTLSASGALGAGPRFLPPSWPDKAP